MTNEKNPGILTRVKAWIGDRLTRLIPVIVFGAVTGAASIYIFAPDAQRGQLVMIAEICLAIGLALGYITGAQLEETQ